MTKDAPEADVPAPINVRKPRDFCGRWPHLAAMDMDFEACRRAFLTRDPRFDGRIFGAVRTTGMVMLIIGTD